MTPAIDELERCGVPYSLHEYEWSGDLHDVGREAADALGLPRDQVFKTLLVDVSAGGAAGPAVRAGDLCVAVVPVDRQVALKAIAAAVGVKRAVMAEPAVAERVTGFVVGGISPFGQRRRLRTVLDASALRFDRVYVSGGRRGLDIGVAPADLVAVLDATPLAIAT